MAILKPAGRVFFIACMVLGMTYVCLSTVDFFDETEQWTKGAFKLAMGLFWGLFGMDCRFPSNNRKSRIRSYLFWALFAAIIVLGFHNISRR